MIKARLTREDGTLVFVFGIDKENVARLKQGRPMKVDLKEMGGSGEVLIHYRDTMAELEADFAPMIGADTKINYDQGLHGNGKKTS